jgi:DNA-binding CsgD family transcriptional regulator
MRELTSDDLRNLLDAVAILNEDLGRDTLPGRVLAAMHKVVRTDQALYSDVDLARGTTANVAAPLNPDWLPDSPRFAVYLRHQRDDPTIAHFARTRDAIPRKIFDFMSARRFMSTGLYSESFGPARIHSLMAVTINEPRFGPRLIGMVVARSRGDFNERERACLAVLRTHAAQAFRNAERFEALRSRLRDRDQGSNGRQLAGNGNRGSASDAWLTKRESEVLYWAASGKTNQEIAMIVGAAAGTVKKHLQHVYEKLGVPNRTAAVKHVHGTLAS